MVKLCKICGKELKRKRYNKRLECLSIFKKRKYCNRYCMAKGQEKDMPSRSAIQLRVRKHVKESCEFCGVKWRLVVHHKDGNWRNNKLNNLQTLCSPCHTCLHHKQGDLVQKKPKPPCSVCGKKSYRINYCSTHLSRFKRNGDPLIVRGKKVNF